MTTVKMVRVSPVQSEQREDHLHEDRLANEIRKLESDFGKLTSLTLLYSLWYNNDKQNYDTVFVAVFNK